MEVALAQEKIWFDKYKYEEAEKVYFESIARLLIPDGYCNTIPDTTKAKVPFTAVPLPKQEDTVIPVPNCIQYLTLSEPHIQDKDFKLRNQNKLEKDNERKGERQVKQDVKVDGIAKLTSDNIAVEINNRLNTLELENAHLKNDVKDLADVVKKLTERIAILEKSGNTSKPSPVINVCQKPPANKPKVEENDDGVDLFGSDSEEEDEEAKKVKEQRLAEYAARKSKKPVLIAKSNIILDIKPWDDETDMKKMEEQVRKVTTDGLIWGASKLVPLAYGIHKLQISSVVEDDKVSVDWLQEQLEAIEDYVQSVDIAAFNKV